MVLSDSDDPLTDTALADEIVLLGDLLAAATDANRALTQAEVDHALGLPDPEPTQTRPRPRLVHSGRTQTA